MAIRVYIERGSKRAFACAIDWPGWCRSGRDEEEAIAALLESAPRFAAAMKGVRPAFTAPKDAAAFTLAARVKGDATTDFGAPGATPDFDTEPLTAAEMRRWLDVLRASWRAFDAAVRKAKGKTLAKGPRGGGRSLSKIVDHVVGAEEGYVGGLGWKYDRTAGASLDKRMETARAAALDGLAASARGEIPARGPRGGKRWTPRKFVRRSAWHWLDHAWEIEDRVG
jgi:hypothetical protein